jgi:hypothetical protein
MNYPRWIEASGFNAFVSGKPIESLKHWGQRQAYEQTKYSKKFKDCIHKPASSIVRGDTIFIYKRHGGGGFHKVANNINTTGKTQKIYIDVPLQAEEDMCLDFPIVIYRPNTLILTKVTDRQ